MKRVPAPAATRTQAKPLAERLGYPPGAKLLIVHADDLGMAHSVDAASVKAFESGLVTSGTIMVPCPWFPEIAAYARSHPEADLGLHLTLTSEWSLYRWGPVLSKERAASLFDESGYLYLTEDVAPHTSTRVRPRPRYARRSSERGPTAFSRRTSIRTTGSTTSPRSSGPSAHSPARPGPRCARTTTRNAIACAPPVCGPPIRTVATSSTKGLASGMV